MVRIMRHKVEVEIHSSLDTLRYSPSQVIGHRSNQEKDFVPFGNTFLSAAKINILENDICCPVRVVPVIKTHVRQSNE